MVSMLTTSTLDVCFVSATPDYREECPYYTFCMESSIMQVSTFFQQLQTWRLVRRLWLYTSAPHLPGSTDYFDL